MAIYRKVSLSFSARHCKRLMMKGLCLLQLNIEKMFCDFLWTAPHCLCYVCTWQHVVTHIRSRVLFLINDILIMNNIKLCSHSGEITKNEVCPLIHRYLKKLRAEFFSWLLVGSGTEFTVLRLVSPSWVTRDVKEFLLSFPNREWISPCLPVLSQTSPSSFQ